jgi:hypothetical protein
LQFYPVSFVIEEMKVLCREAHLNGALRMKRIAIQCKNLERQSMQAEM